MLEEDLKLDEEISHFVKTPEISDAELARFLTNWAAHPDYYTKFTQRVISNVSALNVKLLNSLDKQKRFHLVKALCLTVQLAFSMKQWEFMLGRKDGARYWNNHGLFFSSLHGLIPLLNELQRHISELGQGFTGRIVCLEGESERRFLEVLHLATRLAHFDNHYFVYGGKGAHQNLVYFIRDKNEKGVRVDLSFDGDSNMNDQIPKLKGQVAIKDVFRFERDFEAAFPANLLAGAVTAYLHEYKDKSLICSAKEVSAMLAERKPFVRVVEEEYGVSINKVYFGQFLAIEVLKLSEGDHRVLQGAGVLTGTEISRFIRWVMDWPQEVSPDENEPSRDIEFDVND